MCNVYVAMRIKFNTREVKMQCRYKRNRDELSLKPSEKSDGGLFCLRQSFVWTMPMLGTQVVLKQTRASRQEMVFIPLD